MKQMKSVFQGIWLNNTIVTVGWLKLGFCIRSQLSGLVLLCPTLEGADVTVFCLLWVHFRLVIHFSGNNCSTRQVTYRKRVLFSCLVCWEIEFCVWTRSTISVHCILHSIFRKHSAKLHKKNTFISHICLFWA